MALAPDPRYDLRTALYTFAPGVVPTREVDDALAAQYAANSYTPLTEDQVLAIVTPPPLPTSFPRDCGGCC